MSSSCRTVTFDSIRKAEGRGLTSEEKARVLEVLVSKKKPVTRDGSKPLMDAEMTYAAGLMIGYHVHDKLNELLSGYDLSIMTATVKGPLVMACESGCQECVSICLGCGADPDDAMTSIDMFSGPKNFSKKQRECLNMIYYETKDYNQRLRQMLRANNDVVSSKTLLELEYKPTDWTCQL